MFRYFIKFLMVFTLGLGCLSVSIDANAKANKYASIIVDADSLEILHARKIESSRYPASLTKMMTLYLAFDALEKGEIDLHEPMIVSARAARTAPVKLGLKAGRTIGVEQAILALTVRSANDAAVVLAERLSGSVDEFAAQMNAKAQSLGMRSTVFMNPHGLPNPAQVTTARDMAKLAQALLANHSKYYGYFSRPTFTYQGRTYKTHNSLLGKVEGVDGFKTGYTIDSGYNLVLSAKRNEHRIIAVVLGGATGRSRDQHMTDLIERGFDVIAKNEAKTFNPNLALNTSATQRTVHTLPKPTQNYVLQAAYRTPLKNWTVQIGAYSTLGAAQNVLITAQADQGLMVAGASGYVLPVKRRNGMIYRARLGELSHQKAVSVCKTLAARALSCLVVSPS